MGRGRRMMEEWEGKGDGRVGKGMWMEGIGKGREGILGKKESWGKEKWEGKEGKRKGTK